MVTLAVALLLLLLATSRTAGAAEPWEAESLSPAALEARRASAESERQAAAADPATAAKAEVLATEVRLLDRLLRVLEALKSTPRVEASRARSTGAAAALTAQPTEAPAPPRVRTEEELRPFVERRDATRAALDAAREARVRADGLLKALTASTTEAGSARLEELRAQALVPVPEGAPEVEHLQRRLLGLEQRLLEEERRAAADRERWDEFVKALAAEERLAEAQHQRAVDVFTAAQEALDRALSQDENRVRQKVVEATARRDAATDPLERFGLGVDVEQLSLRLAGLRVQRTATEVATWKEREDRRGKRLATESESLQQRFESAATGSARTGDLLRATLRRLRRSRERLERVELPAIEDRLQWVQQRRAEVQERLFEVEPTLLEDNAAWLALEAALGTGDSERTTRGQTLLRERVFGEDGLVTRLNSHVNELETLQADLTNVESKALSRLGALDGAIALVMRHIYWVRTDDPVSLATLTGGGHEIQQVIEHIARPSVRAPIEDAIASSFVRWIVLGVLTLISILAVILVPRWKGHIRAAWVRRGGPIRQAVVHLLAGLLGAAVVPLLLVAIAQVLDGMLPQLELAQPLIEGLFLLAGVEFGRRFLRRLLRPGGIAEAHLGLAPELAAQVWRAARLAALAAIVLLVPWRVLTTRPFDAPPVHLVHLPRLLYTGFLLALAWSIGRLLPRQGPLVARLVGRSRLAYAVWGVLGPVFLLVLFGIVGMDALGYRIGASFLMENVGQTVVAVLTLGLLYVLLQRLVHRMTARILARATAEGGQHEARRVSAAVFEQLMRVATVAILGVAVIILARFWNLDDLLRTLLQQARLAEHDDGTYLTLWEVFQAILWIAGAHFLVRNLGAILTFLELAVVGDEEGGGTYVLAALLRYAVLLIGYSAALLTLGFSFSSIGWLLAAASVGIGFGLQEIVANFISGLILLLERPVRVGDTISVGESWGTVRQISARATIVENRDRQIVIVPNKELITNYVTNWTRNDRLVRWTLPIGVAYGSDVALVLKILKEVVAANPTVARRPAAEIYFSGFGESSLDFEIWYFAGQPEGRRARSEMHEAIDRRFRDAGVTIPFPQRDLHVVSVPPGWTPGGAPEPPTPPASPPAPEAKKRPDGPTS